MVMADAARWKAKTGAVQCSKCIPRTVGRTQELRQGWALLLRGVGDGCSSPRGLEAERWQKNDPWRGGEGLLIVHCG